MALKLLAEGKVRMESGRAVSAQATAPAIFPQIISPIEI
jgi:hypothetical protein